MAQGKLIKEARKYYVYRYLQQNKGVKSSDQITSSASKHIF